MDGIRNRIWALELADETVVLDDLIRAHAPDAATRDQIGKAAEKLGISPRTLRYKINKLRDLGMPVPAAYARV